jgi:hypothetical protein
VADGLAIPAGLTSITPANHVQELLKSIQYEKLPSENKIEPIKIRSDNLVQQDNRYSSFSCFFPVYVLLSAQTKTEQERRGGTCPF